MLKIGGNLNVRTTVVQRIANEATVELRRAHGCRYRSGALCDTGRGKGAAPSGTQLCVGSYFSSQREIRMPVRWPWFFRMAGLFFSGLLRLPALWGMARITEAQPSKCSKVVWKQIPNPHIYLLTAGGLGSDSYLNAPAKGLRFRRPGLRHQRYEPTLPFGNNEPCAGIILQQKCELKQAESGAIGRLARRLPYRP
jgi:hypothetical protein